MTDEQHTETETTEQPVASPIASDTFAAVNGANVYAT
jgi:hypothetical protein